MIATLMDMLTYARPHGTAIERAFCAHYLGTLPDAFMDQWGNWHVPVEADTSRVLWSCHTDTVHHKQGRIRLIRKGSIVTADPASKRANCLGADDTVGVYLMREMVLAGVPGYYIFHYGEERGAIGSSALAKAHHDWLSERFDHAIALDRQGTHDVVTYQHGRRCASDTFAKALGAALTEAIPSLEYAPNSGVFTDTAEYMDAIPECTNLSVGYYGQHGSNERVDLTHVGRLRAALLKLDVSELPVVRDPKVREYERYITPYYGGGERVHGSFVDDDYEDMRDLVRRYNERYEISLWRGGHRQKDNADHLASLDAAVEDLVQESRQRQAALRDTRQHLLTGHALCRRCGAAPAKGGSSKCEQCQIRVAEDWGLVSSRGRRQ